MDEVLYINKYKPKNINDFKIHKNISEQLINLGKYRNFPNIVLYGLAGSGKTTLINAFIQYYFKEKISTKPYTFHLDKKKTINYKRSDFHYEIIVKKKNFLLYHNIELASI